MTLELANQLTSRLLALTFFFYGLEFYNLIKKENLLGVWSFENLKNEIHPFFHPLLRDRFFVFCIFLLLIISGISFFRPWFMFFVVLFALHLFICMRFRGTYNGGSDMMAIVVLTGILIFQSTADVKIQKLGHTYIAIHTLYSYFKAGLSKAMRAEWYNGKAVSLFFSRALFARNSPFNSQSAGILVILFELSSVGLLAKGWFVSFYFFLALAFHFVNFYYFGLNRFFWIWLSAWPSVLFIFH